MSAMVPIRNVARLSQANVFTAYTTVMQSTILANMTNEMDMCICASLHIPFTPLKGHIHMCIYIYPYTHIYIYIHIYIYNSLKRIRCHQPE